MTSPPPHSNTILPGIFISGLRSVDSLAIPNLARVSLLTGQNNTGKTTVLEGIRLLAEDASPSTISSILSMRNEGDEVSPSGDTDMQDPDFSISSLFSGFPLLSDNITPITLSDGEEARQITISIEWFHEQRDDDGRLRLVPQASLYGAEQERVPAMTVSTPQRQRRYRLDRRFPPSLSSPRRLALEARTPYPVTYVQASGPDPVFSIETMWDTIALTDKEPYVLEALQIIEPNISALSMVGVGGKRFPRRAVVRSSEFPRRVPLGSYGGGTNRLFFIALSVITASGGLLLIDEFENGMHHSIQLPAWELILRLSTILDVQVVATTHSFDCVVAFAQAAERSHKVEGRLFRLERGDGEIRAVQYSEDRLSVVARQRVEVR